MERVFTEQEMQSIFEAEKILREKGLLVDDADGKALVDHNAERFQAYFDLNKSIPVTVQAVLEACELMRNQLHWLSPIQQDHRKIASENPAAAQAVANWLQTQKQLVKSGDEGLQNQFTLLTELRGRDVTSVSIQQAVGRAAYSGRPLHYTPAPPRTDPRQHKDDGKGFAPKSESNLTVREHARRAAEAAQAKSDKTEPPATDYRTLAEAVQGRTHSDAVRIRRMFVMKPGTSEIDWQQTYAARRRAAGL